MTTFITTAGKQRTAVEPRFRLAHPQQDLGVVLRSAGASMLAVLRSARPYEAPTQQALGRIGNMASSPR